MLMDSETDDVVFDVNFWHYRAIVEAIQSLQILSVEYVARLHEPFTGAGLSKDECKIVSAQLRAKVLPALEDEDRLLLDGTITKLPNDGVFYKSESEWHRNYSTNKKVLLDFITAIDDCNGFTVC